MQVIKFLQGAGRGLGGGGAWSAHQRQVDQGATDVAAGLRAGRTRSLPLAAAALESYLRARWRRAAA